MGLLVEGAIEPAVATAPTAGPTGPVAEGVDSIKIGDNNMGYRYFPGRTRVKAGTG
jgi:hypothetical protein